MKLDKIYLINLERRQDRLNHFLNECKREDINMNKVQIFKAIDAKTHSVSEDEIKMFKSIDFDTNNYCGKACVCNQLSHYNILLDIVKNKYKKCVIFQDDVRLKNNFEYELDNVLDNIPKDAEIIWIGLHKMGAGSYFEDFPLNEENQNKYYVKDKVNDYVCRLNNDINPCSLAYIITYNGAKKYIEHIKKNGFIYATDGNFNDYLVSKNIHYGSYNVLCTGNSKFKSDVFEIDDNAIARDMLELLGC
jgi:GR25 family glycosyltransferase involved in LPS biosynthesis